MTHSWFFLLFPDLKKREAGMHGEHQDRANEYKEYVGANYRLHAVFLVEIVL
jgi:hypothetical protein